MDLSLESLCELKMESQIFIAVCVFCVIYCSDTLMINPVSLVLCNENNLLHHH